LSNENLKFILLILSSWYFFSHFLFIKEWDEFYWAQYIKSIYSERSVYNIDSPVLMPRRISGISLLQSYFVYFGKDFIEQKIIFVMGLFFFSLVSPIFLFKNFYKKIFALIIIFFITIFFERMPGTLYLEIYLASFFFFCVFAILEILETKKHYYLFLILISFLGIMKFHGLVLALILTIVFIFKLFLMKKLFTNKEKVILSILPIFFIFYLNFLWSQYLNSNFLQTNIELFGNEVLRLIIQDLFLHDQFIFKKYIYYLWNFDFGNNKLRQIFGIYSNLLPSILEYFLIIVIIQFIFLKYNKRNNQFYLKIIGCVNIGFFIYLFLPYLHELNIQQPVLEDNVLKTIGDPSFSGSTRYTRIYLLSVTFLSVYLLFEILENKKKFNLLFLPIILLSLGLFIFANDRIFYLYKKVNLRINNQKNYNQSHIKITNQIKKEISKQSRVFYINYPSDGYEAMSFRYHLSPIISNNFNWSIGEKINSNDLWSINYTQDELLDALNQDPVYDLKLANNFKKKTINKNYYTHIFIEKNNEKFFKKYSSLFLNYNSDLNGLYLINRDENYKIINFKFLKNY